VVQTGRHLPADEDRSDFATQWPRCGAVPQADGTPAYCFFADSSCGLTMLFSSKCIGSV
jgi:hypothetical protein